MIGFFYFLRGTCQWILFLLNHKHVFYVLHVPVLHAKWLLYISHGLAICISYKTEILFQIPKEGNYCPLKYICIK